MKKLLITGATGFIGRYCLQLLSGSNTFEIHAVSSKDRECHRLNVRWHRADLLDPGQVKELLKQIRPSHLLHFAWYAVPGKYWTSIQNFRWVQTSLGLLEAFALHGGQRAVAAGTCAEYDWKYGYCSENLTPLVPATLYGTCKHSLQIMLDAFSKQTGLSSSWGRIFFLYGPHEHPQKLVSSVIRSLLRGKPASCTHGNQVRDYLYVQDVAEAFIALLNSKVQGPVNIASGHPITLKDIILKIANKTNRQNLVELGVVSTPATEPHLLIADVKRLSDEVGWRPKYDLDYGLEQAIEYEEAELATGKP